MYRERSVFVVVPCYNVAGQIDGVVASMPELVDRIIAVDDASTDDTAAVLARIGDPRLEILRHERNGGVGAAMVTGWRRAAELGADIMVKMDGDGQMDPRHLAALLDPLIDQGYDYAKGNRLLSSKAYASMPRLRLVGNFILTFLTKLASGYWQVLDPQNGYVAIRRETWELLDDSRIAQGYFFENDMLVNLNIVGARVRDVPMPARYQGEPSSLRVQKVILPFALLMLHRTAYRFFAKYVLRDFSPIALFVLAGVPLFLWGMLFGAWSWWSNASRGVFTSTGTVMLSVLPLLVGFELLLQALVLDIQESKR